MQVAGGAFPFIIVDRARQVLLDNEGYPVRDPDGVPQRMSFRSMVTLIQNGWEYMGAAAIPINVEHAIAVPGQPAGRPDVLVCDIWRGPEGAMVPAGQIISLLLAMEDGGFDGVALNRVAMELFGTPLAMFRGGEPDAGSSDPVEEEGAERSTPLIIRFPGAPVTD